MLAEALEALAAAGSTALVTAMVTDGWEGIRTRFARLLGRRDAAETQRAAALLEQSRATLAASGAEAQRVRAEQEIAWRTQLINLLESDPGAAQELGALVAGVATHVSGSAGWIAQHAVASGQAQQAVLGQGVQNVSFGGQHGPDASQG